MSVGELFARDVIFSLLHASCKMTAPQASATSISLRSDYDYGSIISKAAQSLGYSELKKEQHEAVMKFVTGNDVFISLPTGFGKSLCYIILPRVFDLILGIGKKSIVLVVSPLVALMKDQVAATTKMGLSAAYISDSELNTAATKHAAKKGEYQVLFVSPESLFLSPEWRNMLSSNHYRSHLVGFIIDEAHCIKKW